MNTVKEGDNFTPRPINPDDKSYRDVMMLFSDQPVQPKYWFEGFGDYWSCSCGQINRDETCSNCGLGRELLRQIFVLHKQGQTGTGPEYDKASSGKDTGPVSPENDIAPEPHIPADQDPDPEAAEEMRYKKRKRIARIIVLIVLFLILLLAGGLLAFYYYYLPELNRQEAANADATTDSLARELPAIMKPIADASLSVYINAGDEHYEKKEYVEAISYYEKALKIKSDESVRQKILAAKFNYVSHNQDTGGKTFKKYLEDLKKAKYPGAENIYERTYSWKAKIVTNTGSGDFSTDMSSINRTNLVYFHTSFSGGAPGDVLKLYYEIVWPDGTSERQDISATKASGDNVTTRCEYTYPKAPGEVQMTYRLYNYEDDSLLATDSVTLL